MRAALAYRASASSTPSAIPATSTSNAALARHRSKRQRWRPGAGARCVGHAGSWRRPAMAGQSTCAGDTHTGCCCPCDGRIRQNFRAPRCGRRSRSRLGRQLPRSCAATCLRIRRRSHVRRAGGEAASTFTARARASRHAGPGQRATAAPVVTPPAFAPSAETMPAQPATVSEPAQDDAQLAMAVPPPPAPSAASNDDVQANGALEARMDSSAPPPHHQPSAHQRLLLRRRYCRHRRGISRRASSAPQLTHLRRTKFR